MTDEQPSTTPIPAEPIEAPSQTSSIDVAPVDPPPASAVVEGVAAQPPGEPRPSEASTLPPTILIEAPIQGAALERGDASIPPADAQPILSVADVAKIQGVIDGAESAAPAEAGHAEEPAAGAPAAQEPNQYGEHPHLTLDRLRTKLSAYGVECLKTIENEVNYLYTLCDPPTG